MLGKWLFLLVRSLLRILPINLALFFGKCLGWLWYYIIPIRKKMVQTQIRERLGTGVDERLVSRTMFENLGMNLVEFVRMDPSRPDDIASQVKRRYPERLEQAVKAGKGVFIVTAHFGNWDLLACSQALSGLNLTVLSKKIKPAWLNDYWMTTREQCGVEILPEKGVRSDLMDRLKQGGSIGFAIDQHMPEKKGIVVDFLGRPASTTPGLAELAIDSGATIIPAFLFRSDDNTHIMDIGLAIEVDKQLSRQEAIFDITRKCNEALERAIRKQPDHWLWLHRRWKVD